MLDSFSLLPQHILRPSLTFFLKQYLSWESFSLEVNMKTTSSGYNRIKNSSLVKESVLTLYFFTCPPLWNINIMVKVRHHNLAFSLFLHFYSVRHRRSNLRNFGEYSSPNALIKFSEILFTNRALCKVIF